MVRVTIRAVRSEGDDHVRPGTADFGGDPGDDRRRVAPVQLAVHLVQQHHPPDPERRRGPFQLPLSDPAELPRAGVGERIAGPAALAAGRGDKHRFHSLSRVLREGAAEPERFVVRVGEDAHQRPRPVCDRRCGPHYAFVMARALRVARAGSYGRAPETDAVECRGRGTDRLPSGCADRATTPGWFRDRLADQPPLPRPGDLHSPVGFRLTILLAVDFPLR